MGWRFRKRISLGKFIKLNVSKSGVSTTFGVKGFSYNVGKKGVYRNVGIPGTGIYRRDKVNTASNSYKSNTYTQPVTYTPPVIQYETICRNDYVQFTSLANTAKENNPTEFEKVFQPLINKYKNFVVTCPHCYKSMIPTHIHKPRIVFLLFATLFCILSILFADDTKGYSLALLLVAIPLFFFRKSLYVCPDCKSDLHLSYSH